MNLATFELGVPGLYILLVRAWDFISL